MNEQDKVAELKYILVRKEAKIKSLEMVNLFATTTTVDIPMIKMIIYVLIGIYTALSVIICIVNICLFKKGVDVD